MEPHFEVLCKMLITRFRACSQDRLRLDAFEKPIVTSFEYD